MNEILKKLKTKYLFSSMLIISIFLHGSIYGAYWIAQRINIEDFDSSNIQESDISLDEIPPELIGGNSSPAPVEKSEWVEGSNKNADDPSDEDINVNAVSGNGTDKDGFLFSFNGDKPPSFVLDVDTKQFFPPAAKAANITEKQVILLVQVDETGKLISAKVVSGKAGFGFDEAAIKVVSLAKIYPGYIKGKPVKMAHRLPINFTLDE